MDILPEAGTNDVQMAGLFEVQSNLRNVFSIVCGEVRALVEDGFTDEQARAIVATTFGWRPPTEGA